MLSNINNEAGNAIKVRAAIRSTTSIVYIVIMSGEPSTLSLKLGNLEDAQIPIPVNRNIMAIAANKIKRIYESS